MNIKVLVALIIMLSIMIVSCSPEPAIESWNGTALDDNYLFLWQPSNNSANFSIYISKSNIVSVTDNGTYLIINVK